MYQKGVFGVEPDGIYAWQLGLAGALNAHANLDRCMVARSWSKVRAE